MKFTFLLPAYKSDYLRNALKSILKQSFSDFGVIVSDDCSPEDLRSIVNECHDTRVVYRRNSENIGAQNLVTHWNSLLQLAQSEYTILASDDDFYAPSFLSEVNALTLRYTNVNVFRGRCNRINSKDEITSEDDLYEEYLSQLKFSWSVFNTNYIGCIANFVFKTRVLKEIGGFVNFPYAWFSDTATAIKLAMNGICNTSEIVFNFRLSNINISSTTRNKVMECGKMEATLLFDEWMASLIDTFTENDSLLEKNYLSQLINSYKKVIYSHTGDYSWAFSTKKLFDVYSRLKHIKYFNKKTFFKSYILAVLYRRIN